MSEAGVSPEGSQMDGGLIAKMQGEQLSDNKKSETQMDFSFNTNDSPQQPVVKFSIPNSISPLSRKSISVPTR